MAGALQGIKVIEVGLLIQGPQAAALLADMGADVIKVELPGIGDQGRYIFLGDGDLRSAVFIGCNRGKRGLTLDLRHEQGANIFKKLTETADIVISNFKPGTLDEWGLGYEDLAAINPRIIWAAGSTFGPVGPDAAREGADLAGQSAGGLISTTGSEGDPPTPVGAFIADHIGSLNEARVRTWSTNRGIARGRPDLGAGDRIYTLSPNGKHPGPIEFWSSADPGGLSNFSDRRRVDRPYWSIRRSEGRFLCARWPSRNGDGSTLRRAVTFPRRTEVLGR